MARKRATKKKTTPRKRVANGVKAASSSADGNPEGIAQSDKTKKTSVAKACDAVTSEGEVGAKKKPETADPQALETEYQNLKEQYAAGVRKFREQSQRFDALDDMYQKLEAEDSRDAAFACRVEKYEMAGSLYDFELGLGAQLKQL